MQKIVKLHGNLLVFFICYMDYTENECMHSHHSEGSAQAKHISIVK